MNGIKQRIQRFKDRIYKSPNVDNLMILEICDILDHIIDKQNNEDDSLNINSEKDINTAIELLKKHEGFRSKPYKCTSGKLTIGYGLNLEDKGITEEQAEYLLRDEVKSIKEKLTLELSFFKDLNEIRKAVLIDMAYNLGINGFLNFKKTINALKQGKYEEASKEMLDSKWAFQVGNRATSLSLLMRHGE